MNENTNKSLIRVNSNLGNQNLQAYIKELHKIPLIEEIEERKLVELKEDGDTQAAQQLVLSNLWFVVHIAKEFTGYKIPLPDLIQEGNVGLMKAIKNFNSEHNVRITSYAVHWIKSEIYKYVLKNSSVVKLATTKPQLKLFFKLKSQKTHDGGFTEEEINDVAHKFNVKPSDVKEMEVRLFSKDLSFESSIGSGAEPDVEKYNTPAHYMHNNEPDPCELLETELTEHHTKQLLYSSLNTLSQRERDVVQRRWLD